MPQTLSLRSVLFAMLCPSAAAFAQLSTANVIGSVQDTSGAGLPATSLRLINVQTGTENDSSSNGEGDFTLPGILPGAYTLRIERRGFATTEVDGLTLNVGDTRNLLIRMKVGPVSESITVDASGLTLNTTDAAVSTVVDRRFVNNIPLNGRSFQDLISMTPGVTTQSPQAAAQGSTTPGDFSVNGQRPDANSFFVDGVSANINSGISSDHSRVTTAGSSGGATALGTTQSLVSIDALQEFRVLSSTYSAEYGRTPGGQFTFLTRSGTSALHGSLYYYWRDYVVNGSDWFTAHPYTTFDPQKVRFSQDDFGGTIGAPLHLPGHSYGQDKTFLFGSYEGLLLTEPSPFIYTYQPSYNFIQSVPPAVAKVLAVFDGYSDPNSTQPLIVVTSGGYSLPAHVNSTSVRVDHTVSSRLSFFLRYGDTPSSEQTYEHVSLTTSNAHTRTLTLGANTQLSGSRNNDFRLGFARSTEDANTAGGHAPGTFYYGPTLSEVLGVPASSGTVAADVYIRIPGIGESEVDSNSLNSVFNQWNLRDTFNLQTGRHALKFGIDQRHIHSTFTPPALSVEADYLDTQSLLNNAASQVVVSQNQPARPSFNEFSAFAQDEWKVSNSLNLSLGLRWEVNPPPTGSDGANAFTALGRIDQPASLRLAPRGTPLWHTGWSNLAPRFGSAWRIGGDPGRELILRTGAGIFFDTGTQPAWDAFRGLGFSATTVTTNAPLPITPAQLNFSPAVAEPYTSANVFLFPSHLQLPYSIQWNAGIEKAFGKDQSLTVSYVGASGQHLLAEQRRDINALNPSFGEIYSFPRGVTSNYQSLQLRFQRSIAHGIQALADYTYAHTLDFGSTDPSFPLVRGNSDLDVRHNLEAALTWSAPRPEGGLLRRTLLGGWGFDGRVIARSGFPVPLFGNLLTAPFTGERYYSGVNLIPGQPLYLRGSQYPGGRILNGGPDALNPAFALPDGPAPGNAPRNIAGGFQAVQVNVAGQRQIHIYERLNIQFRAEAFNVLNHPNFGYVDPILTDELFGQPTKMLNQSFGPGGSLYQQGGPRSVQLSIKGSF